jgi:hypothetical protein
MTLFDDQPGVYVIRCTVNGASYTGSSAKVLNRLRLHVTLLRSGSSRLDHLQRDWDTYGSEAFEMHWCHKPLEELWYWEEAVTMLTDSMIDHGGYNKMLGNRAWSLSSRVRNTEEKLHKTRKFFFLPGVVKSQRLNSGYVHSFCQGVTAFSALEPVLAEGLAPSRASRASKERLAGYRRFIPSVAAPRIFPPPQ